MNTDLQKSMLIAPSPDEDKDKGGDSSQEANVPDENNTTAPADTSNVKSKSTVADNSQSAVVAKRTDAEKAAQAIQSQLHKLEDDTDLTSASDFRVAQSWEAINSTLGLSAVAISGAVTILGAAASVKGMEAWQPGFTFGTTILASAATVVGSVLTFLKPSERAGRYREFGNKQKALRNRIRIYRTVVMTRDELIEDTVKRLLEFGSEKDALNSDNPPIPRSAFAKASKEILEKRKRRAILDQS